MELASIWPADATSPWRCGRPNHKTNAADLDMCQEVGCIITKQSMSEVAAVLWTMSLQACSELSVVESRALPSGSPAMELQKIIFNSCGAHKVGPLIDTGNALACTECKEGVSKLAPSTEGDPDSDDLNMDTDPSFNLVNLFQEPPVNDHALMRKNLRGDSSDRLWPSIKGSTYLSDLELLGLARITGMPAKLHSCRLKADEIRDACGCWIMIKAMDNKAVQGNPIITRLPKKISSQSRGALENRLSKLTKLADIPAPHEKTNGSNPEDHVTFRFEHPSSDRNLTQGEGGAPSPAPRTYSLDASTFMRAASTMVAAMTNANCSLDPRQLTENILRNVDRKRKRGEEGKGSSAAATPGVEDSKRQKRDQSSSKAAPDSSRIETSRAPNADVQPSNNRTNLRKDYKIPRVRLGQGVGEGSASGGPHHLTTQGSGTSPPVAAETSSNFHSEYQNQRRGNSQHNGNVRNQGSRGVRCKLQIEGVVCGRFLQPFDSFCPGCGGRNTNLPSNQSGQIRSLHRGRGRGYYRGRGNSGRGGTGAHRGRQN